MSDHEGYEGDEESAGKRQHQSTWTTLLGQGLCRSAVLFRLGHIYHTEQGFTFVVINTNDNPAEENAIKYDAKTDRRSQKDRQADGHRQTNRQTGKQEDKQVDLQTDRLTGKQTYNL